MCKKILMFSVVFRIQSCVVTDYDCYYEHSSTGNTRWKNLMCFSPIYRCIVDIYFPIYRYRHCVTKRINDSSSKISVTILCSAISKRFYCRLALAIKTEMVPGLTFLIILCIDFLPWSNEIIDFLYWSIKRKIDFLSSLINWLYRFPVFDLSKQSTDPVLDKQIN